MNIRAANLAGPGTLPPLLLCANEGTTTKSHFFFCIHKTRTSKALIIRLPCRPENAEDLTLTRNWVRILSNVVFSEVICVEDFFNPDFICFFRVPKDASFIKCSNITVAKWYEALYLLNPIVRANNWTVCVGSGKEQEFIKFLYSNMKRTGLSVEHITIVVGTFPLNEPDQGDAHGNIIQHASVVPFRSTHPKINVPPGYRLIGSKQCVNNWVDDQIETQKCVEIYLRGDNKFLPNI